MITVSMIVATIIFLIYMARVLKTDQSNKFGIVLVAIGLYLIILGHFISNM